jgi:pimeloyl-ACP methyl ester carboxylesterase
VLSLTLTLTVSLSPALPEAPPPRLVGEPVELKTPAGPLAGTIDLPPGPGPWPVVLVHPGSGPTDKDGNSVFTPNNSLKLLGRGLAAKGIAVLRIDKLGVGGSAKILLKEEDARLERYAADVTAWVALLRKDPRFTKVGIIGHSEGALIGLLAAADAKPDAFVSLCGPGRPLAEVVREQLKARLPKELAEAAEKTIAELEAGRTVKDPPAALNALFRPSVQPYLISLFSHDPAKLAAAYPGPLLVVTGTTDIQISAADGNRLVAAKPGARHVAIEGMNHVLKPVAKAELIAQLPSYRDPTIPLHPEVVGELAGFLRSALGPK